MRTVFRNILVCLILMCGFSCAGFTSSVSAEEDYSSVPKNVRPMPVSEFFNFENIPAPKGYKLDKKKSFVFRNEVLVVAFLTYKGKSKADEVVGFFRGQLPLYGWRLVNIVEYGERVLNFEMDNQTCIITVAKKGKSFTIATAPRRGLNGGEQSVPDATAAADENAPSPVTNPAAGSGNADGTEGEG